jgi:ParB family chromosome partitioning protein
MTREVQDTAQPPAGKAGRFPVQPGEVRDIALNKLKASPRNARRVGHSAEDIEARAASIRFKGLLQPLVVEPEIKEGGQESGYYLVTIGEGRRQALRLLAKRKLLSKTEPVRCVVDTTNDPAEISLDENISRRDMHPADQFEAFKDLADRKGYGVEEIAARSGVSPQIVRQRLRLGAVAPALLDLYRQEALTLEQVTAFAVNPDPERQMQVYAQLSQMNRQPYAIRRAMTDTKVPADDRRVLFVGLDAYVEAGGPVLRDLFTEDRGGWVEDVVLLDRLVLEKLEAIAVNVRDDEGWKWSAGFLDAPTGHGCSRVWERVLPRSPEDAEAIAALQAEDAALTDQWADVEPLPPEVAARFEAIQEALDGFGEDYGFDPAERARAGVFVILSAYGQARIDRGFVRPEDEPAPEPEFEAEDDEDTGVLDGEDDAAGAGALGAGAGEDDEDEPAEEPVGDPGAPLPARLVADLTAYRTAALRDALAGDPDLALIALVHALALRVFGIGGFATCLDIRMGSHVLSGEADSIEDSAAGLANAERHAAWARQVPDRAEAMWDFVVGLDGDSRAALLAHCVSLSLNAVRGVERRPLALAHAETLATALDLDMTAYWKPTAARYLDRVTKAHVLAAVTEGVSDEAAGRIAGLKKPDMVAAAEPLLAGTGWLPALLRTAKPDHGQVEAGPAEAAEGTEADATDEADQAEGVGDLDAEGGESVEAQAVAAE